jgi:uncharacterized protein
MTDLLLAFGLVAVLEGLVLALAPLRLEDLLELLRRMSLHNRRVLGLAVVGLGVFLIWLSKNIF